MVYSLQSAYPNPFNPTITFLIGVPKASQVKLHVFNMMGQEVSVIHSGELRAGYYRFSWNANRFASGNYIVRMEAPNFEKTRMIQYIK